MSHFRHTPAPQGTTRTPARAAGVWSGLTPRDSMHMRYNMDWLNHEDTSPVLTLRLRD